MRNTDFEVLTLIRDANIPGNVKLILYAVELRGEHFGKWSTLAADAGLRKDAYYSAKKKADDLGLLETVRRFNSSSVVTVNAEALRRVPRHSGNPEPKEGDADASSQSVRKTRTVIPENQNEHSGIQNEDSGIPERKYSIKDSCQGVPLRTTTNQEEPEGSSALATDRETSQGSDRPAGQSSQPWPANDSEPKEDFRPRPACSPHAQGHGYDPWCKDCIRLGSLAAGE